MDCTTTEQPNVRVLRSRTLSKRKFSESETNSEVDKKPKTDSVSNSSPKPQNKRAKKIARPEHPKPVSANNNVKLFPIFANKFKANLQADSLLGDTKRDKSHTLCADLVDECGTNKPQENPNSVITAVIEIQDKESVDIVSKSENSTWSEKEIKLEEVCFPNQSSMQSSVILELNPFQLRNVEFEIERFEISPWTANSKLTASYSVDHLESSGNLTTDLAKSSDAVNLQETCESSTKCNVEHNILQLDKSKHVTINQIKAWLGSWKDRFTKSSSKTTEYCSSDDSNDSVDSIPNAIIVTGFPGVGKTSVVHKIAESLGFTVLEVNASSSRSGQKITLKLQEAFQSYHVTNAGISDYFQTAKTAPTNSMHSKTENTHLAEVQNSKVTVTKSQPKLSRKLSSKELKSPPTVTSSGTLHAFFSQTNKKSQEIKPDCSKQEEKDVNIKLETLQNDGMSLKNKFQKRLSNSKAKDNKKISSLTLILFDDVDVIFEEDEGFWCAVNTLLRDTKKPVVFTTTRNLEIVQRSLSRDYEVFCLNEATKQSVTENVKCEGNIGTFQKFAAYYNFDIRKTVHELQFWEKSKQGLPSNSKCTRVSSTRKVDQPGSHISNDSSDADSLLFNFEKLKPFNDIELSPSWNFVTDKLNLDSQESDSNCEGSVKLETIESSSDISEEYVQLFEDISVFDVLQNQLNFEPSREKVKLWCAGLPNTTEEHNLVDYYSNLDLVTELNNMIFLKSAKLYSAFHTDETELQISEKIDLFNTNDTINQLNLVETALQLCKQISTNSVNLDYMSTLKNICLIETQKQNSSFNRCRRFFHYFNSICIPLCPKTLMRGYTNENNDIVDV